MANLQPSGSGEISHNSYALNSFAPSHRRVGSSSQTLTPAPRISSYNPPPPVTILNSLSPIWDTQSSVPKKKKVRRSGTPWESGNESPTNAQMQDESFLGPFKKAISPLKHTGPLDVKTSAYIPSKSTPSSFRSRSNSSSSSVTPLTSGEPTPAKPYQYTTRRAHTHPVVSERPPAFFTKPPDATLEVSMTTHSLRTPNALIRVKQQGERRETDSDLSQHQHRARTEAYISTVIRDSEPQSHIIETGPEKEYTKAEISVPIVPSRRKESLPQAIFSSPIDGYNHSPSKNDSTVTKTWGRRRGSAHDHEHRASSIFKPHLIPIPKNYPPGQENSDDDELPGTPGIRRKDDRNGWSGEWNQANIQDVIDKLRALR